MVLVGERALGKHTHGVWATSVDGVGHTLGLRVCPPELAVRPGSYSEGQANVLTVIVAINENLPGIR